jgi:hypothetical protein
MVNTKPKAAAIIKNETAALATFNYISIKYLSSNIISSVRDHNFAFIKGIYSFS